jgi:hypothetical protein
LETTNLDHPFIRNSKRKARLPKQTGLCVKNRKFYRCPPPPWPPPLEWPPLKLLCAPPLL